MIRVLWKVRRLDVTGPSVRIRALTPIMFLRRVGFDINVTDERPSEEDIRRSDVVVISKCFAERDMWLADKASEVNKAIVIDLCDDVFTEARASAAAGFRQQATVADMIVTTGEVLRETINRQVRDPDKIRIIPDHAETLTLTRDLIAMFPPRSPQERARIFERGTVARLVRRWSHREGALARQRRTIVWFGVPGIPDQGVGIDALAAIAPYIGAVAADIPLQLLIVSSDHARARRVAKSFAFPWAFRQWRLLSAYEHVAKADVCVIPNPPTAYATAKSPNRAMMALSVGTPVVASSSPAYLPLAHAMVLDDWDFGLRRYLTGRVAADADIAAARGVMDRMFNPEILRDSWARALVDAVQRAKARRPPVHA